MEEQERVAAQAYRVQKQDGNGGRGTIGNAAGRHIVRTFEMERGTKINDRELK